MKDDIAIWAIAANGELTPEAIPLRRANKMHKLVQRVVICLLTPTGDVAADPTFGTDFIPLLRESGIPTPIDVHYAFGVAERQIATQLAYPIEQDPAARYLHSTLDDVSVYGMDIGVTITVYNADQDRQQISFELSVED